PSPPRASTWPSAPPARPPGRSPVRSSRRPGRSPAPAPSAPSRRPRCSRRTASSRIVRRTGAEGVTPRDAPGAPGVPYAPGTPGAPGPVGPLELVWEDRFEGPVGTLPDPAHWCPDLLAPGAKNGELQRYTADPRNIALDGEGRLVLT